MRTIPPPAFKITPIVLTVASNTRCQKTSKVEHVSEPAVFKVDFKTNLVADSNAKNSAFIKVIGVGISAIEGVVAHLPVSFMNILDSVEEAFVRHVVSIPHPIFRVGYPQNVEIRGQTVSLFGSNTTDEKKIHRYDLSIVPLQPCVEVTKIEENEAAKADEEREKGITKRSQL